MCWIVINCSVLGPLTNALSSLQNSCVSCIVCSLGRRAGSADSRYRWKLLHAHFHVRQLDISFRSTMQETGSYATGPYSLSICHRLRVSSEIWNAEIVCWQGMGRRSELIGEDLSVRIDVIRKHELLVLDVGLVAHLIDILRWVT